jgi:imidazole glycerol-phosphate synthase subunit HisH
MQYDDSPVDAYVVDMGINNLLSLVSALEDTQALKSLTVITANDVERIGKVDRSSVIVLPGNGNFGEASLLLAQSGLSDQLRAWALQGGGLIGICLGMQLLFDESDESPGSAGLGLIPGRCRMLDREGATVPNMGWSGLKWRSPRLPSELSDLGRDVFFNHSFRVETADPYILAWGENGREVFPAIVRSERVIGMQFHPEKSAEAGINLLRHFLWRS